MNSPVSVMEMLSFGQKQTKQGFISSWFKKRLTHVGRRVEIQSINIKFLQLTFETGNKFGSSKWQLKVMRHYLKNKVGVVDFANAQGVVMF